MSLLQLPFREADPFANMAIDRALLDAAGDHAIFRAYGWTERAATFGYTQRFAAVREATFPEATRCRRPTGGGIVDHRDDWTYMLALPRSSAGGGGPATATYAAVHRALADAFEALGVGVRLAPCDRDARPAPGGPASECFRRPAPSDVLSPDGQKLAGAALKRTRDGLLLQGSVARSGVPRTFAWDALEPSFIEHLRARLDLGPARAAEPNELVSAVALGRLRDAFASDAWNRRR